MNKANMKPEVLILMGSETDLPIMEETAKVLEEFGIGYAMHISSAHRSPQKTVELSSGAASRGVKVIIAGAGMAAHLAGVVAAETPLPVIAVPLPGGALNGVDALYAMSKTTFQIKRAWVLAETERMKALRRGLVG